MLPTIDHFSNNIKNHGRPVYEFASYGAKKNEHFDHDKSVFRSFKIQKYVNVENPNRARKSTSKPTLESKKQTEIKNPVALSDENDSMKTLNDYNFKSYPVDEKVAHRRVPTSFEML